MTTENTTATEDQGTRKNGGPRPTHTACVQHGKDKNSAIEQIGVAWKAENGTLFVKLAGTQLISQFSLHEIPVEQTAEE